MLETIWRLIWEVSGGQSAAVDVPYRLAVITVPSVASVSAPVSVTNENPKALTRSAEGQQGHHRAARTLQECEEAAAGDLRKNLNSRQLRLEMRPSSI